MCGFTVSLINSVNETTSGVVGSDIAARGPDAINSKLVQIGELNLLIEFAHLFITEPKTYQPLEAEQYLLVLNGEIYNHEELFDGGERVKGSINDTQNFFLHILKHGLENTLQKANGMYAGILINKNSGKCIAFTDHIGKKPLLIWENATGWHISTGIDKSYIDESSRLLRVLKPSIYEIELKSGKVSEVLTHKHQPAPQMNLKNLLQSAVIARVPKNLPFAVALSGGLDSAILASIIETQLCLSPEYFVVGEKLPATVTDLALHLGIDDRRIKLIKPSINKDLRTLLAETCAVVKSYNPSIISNGMATMMLSNAIRDAGYKVLISGEGADEFFCGYQAMYNGKNCPDKMRLELVADLHFTELRRLDLISSHFGLEARCPFLDRRVTQFALSEPANHHCNIDTKTGKLMLRELYRGLLPSSIVDAHKEPFDITSGLQKKVITILKSLDQSERVALKVIFRKAMGEGAIFNHDYFSKYPAFDEMIDKRDKKYQVE